MQNTTVTGFTLLVGF